MQEEILSSLPWEHNDSGLINGQTKSETDEAPFIADTADCPALGAEPIEKARANYIIQACNAHPAMLEALNRVAWYLDKEDDQNIVNEVNDAIAKATQGGPA